MLAERSYTLRPETRGEIERRAVVADGSGSNRVAARHAPINQSKISSHDDDPESPIRYEEGKTLNYHVIKRSDKPRLVEEVILDAIRAVVGMREQHGESVDNDNALESLAWLLRVVPSSLAEEIGVEYVPKPDVNAILKAFYRNKEF